MKVPDAPLPSVSLNPLPEFKVPVVYAPRVNPGEALAQPVATMLDAKNQADSVMIEEQLNNLQAQKNSLQTEAASRLGGNVLPTLEHGTFVDEYMTKFNAAASKLGTNLRDKRQQLFFQKRADLIGSTFRNVLDAHEKDQMQVYADGVDKGTIETESKNAVQNIGSSQDLSIGQMRIKAAVDSMATRHGWAPEMKDWESRKAMSQFHASVLGSALQSGKLEFAKTYLDQHADEVTPEIQAEVRGYVDDQERFRRVDDAVDEVDASPLNYADKAQRLRDLFRNDEKGQKEAINELRARREQRDVARAENIGAIWDMKTGLNGQPRRSLREIMQTPAWMDLSGTERKSLARDFEADDRRNEGRETPADAVRKYAAYLKITDDPRALVNASDQEIIGKCMGVLGEGLTKKLLEDKRRIAKNQDELNQATIENQEFKDLAREYGLKVDGTLTSEDQATLGLLRVRVRDAIRHKQQATGKALDQGQKEAEMRNLLKQVPTRKPGGPLSSALTGDTKHAFQFDGSYEIGATDDEKARAYQYLVRNGAQTTPANMWTMIQAMRGVQQ